jgi:hypothetical protein
MGEVEQKKILPPLSPGFAIGDISPVPGEVTSPQISVSKAFLSAAMRGSLRR